MERVALKAGQVAAVLKISVKRLQNSVDAGYLQPTQSGGGRGSVREYSFEDVVRMQALEILIGSYGVAPPRAAQMLDDVWPRRFTRRAQTLIIAPSSPVPGVRLEPIRLPLGEIAASAELRIRQVLADYREKKRGRPAGWSSKFNTSLAEASRALQGVSDAQIEREICASRQRRAMRKRS
jgi:DNA-binding transcriptional MerR regulator